MKPDLDVPASATPDEAAAIVTAIERVLAQRRVVNNAPETPQRSAWAEAARREAIVDRV